MLIVLDDLEKPLVLLESEGRLLQCDLLHRGPLYFTLIGVPTAHHSSDLVPRLLAEVAKVLLVDLAYLAHTPDEDLFLVAGPVFLQIPYLATGGEYLLLDSGDLLVFGEALQAKIKELSHEFVFSEPCFGCLLVETLKLHVEILVYHIGSSGDGFNCFLVSFLPLATG